MSSLQSLKYSRAAGTLEVLDQLKVPHATIYVPVVNCEEAWSVIRKMQVRGAPLIAIVAALGLAVEAAPKAAAAESSGALSSAEACAYLLERMQYLRTSRPTAVNLFKCTDELARVVESASGSEGATYASVVAAYVGAAEAMLAKDVGDNKAIGRHGAEAIVRLISSKKGVGGEQEPGAAKARVMTICNTGSLATAGYGTALGVVRSLQAQGKLEVVYACETRPYNQGSRLTAFELVSESLPGVLICDSMAAAAMREKGVDAVVVGADRVAANGDTANKIGTYQLAITAAHHGAGFYVAAPSTSIDLGTPNGAAIEIEERPAQELRRTAGVQIAPEGVAVWNPAFDYAPADLITGIITEHGVISKDPATGLFDIKGFLERKDAEKEEEEEKEAAAKPEAKKARLE